MINKKGTLESIGLQSETATFDSWIHDERGTGLKNTQQLDIDWSQWENHVFFHSAEAKANIAIDKIINQYPFDGSTEEKFKFFTDIDGFTKWIFDQIDSNAGYIRLSGGSYVFSKDLTGWLAPELSNSEIGLSVAVDNMQNTGASVEFWFNHDPNQLNRNGLIFQKLSGQNKGITVASECDASGNVTLHFQISSDDYLSIVSSVSGLTAGTWAHVAFVYHRGNSERVETYVNGVLHSTTEKQAELDDIVDADSPIWIGNNPTGIVHHSTEASSTNTGFWSNLSPLEACIDEFRLWSHPKSAAAIYNDIHKNINAQPGLSYYLRFNEPGTYGSYLAKNIILDFSGNSYHSVYVANGTSHDWSIDSTRAGDVQSATVAIFGEPPLQLELEKDNKILFPDWPPTMEFNENLVKSGNHYDINNPNLITKLVPRHYFEEATFFEGIETSIDEPIGLQQRTSQGNSADYSQHVHSKVPSKTIMFSFLLVWAAYFDDIKLYIDMFTSLDKVDYTGKNQIPKVLLEFLTDYYGLKIINPFNSETLDKYREGRNIIGENELAEGSLDNLVQQLWRRILVNMPFLLRSRGTIQGVKALMNTIGVEANSYFRLREYGGSINNTISSSRVEQTATVVGMDFSDGGYVVTPELKAYRHEPGLPDPFAAPQEGEVIFQSGDITISTPDVPGPMTQFLSGSWAVEGIYQLDPDVPTQSLFSIINTDINDQNPECVVNLVASRSDGDANNVFMELTLHSKPYSNDAPDSNNSQVVLENIDIWDGSDWYVAVSNKWQSDSREITMYIGKTSLTEVVEWHEKTVVVPRDNTQLPASLTMTNPDNIHRLYVSDSLLTPSNILFSDTNKSPSTYSYNGKLHGLKVWTSDISKDQAIEHCKNVFSTSLSNPQIDDPIPKYYQGVKVHEYSGLVKTELPSGSWQRLRAHYPGLEGLEQNKTEIIDTTQNEYHLTVSAVTLEERKIRYSTVSDLITAGVTENKIRVRSYQNPDLARANGGFYGELYELPLEVGLDDRRFSIESSIVHALNKDMINLLGNMELLNEYIGAPELEYAVDYPEIRRVRDLYFQRLVANMPYNSVIEFQRWFNNNFASLIQDFVPYTADFLGINFVIESHILERHKFEYKQGDVHVDLNDRLAITQVPIIMGTTTNNIV